MSPGDLVPRGQLMIRQSSVFSPSERISDCSHNRIPLKSQREADDEGLNFKGKADLTASAADSDFSGFVDSEHNKVLTTDARTEGPDMNATMAVDSGFYSNWKGLMPDILGVILKSLPLADNIRFGAVCTNWYSAAAQSCHPPAPQPPFLLLPGDSTGTSDHFQFFDFSFNKFHNICLPKLCNRRCLGSSQGKLIYIDERAELHVLDPITTSHFDLPSITTFDYVGDPEFDEDGNMSGYWYDHDLGCTPPEVYPIGHFIDLYYTKVIICPKTSVIIAISMERMRIAFCLPGDMSWTTVDTIDPIGELPIRGFTEIVFYKDVLYALTRSGELLSFNVSDDLKAIKYEVLCRDFMPRTSGDLSRYLVEADGELLLVWRFSDDVGTSDTNHVFAGVTSAEDVNENIIVTFEFKVFKMNWGRMLWEEMKSLGEYALFLGLSNSLSFSSRYFPELKANSIYFTDDDEINLGLSPRLKRDMGVFNLEDGTIKPCYPCDGDLRLNWPPPIWFTPKGLASRYLNVVQ